jgi:hypothetical protein
MSASKSAEIFAGAYDPPEHLWLAVHFSPSAANRAAGLAFQERPLWSIRVTVEGGTKGMPTERPRHPAVTLIALKRRPKTNAPTAEPALRKMTVDPGMEAKDFQRKEPQMNANERK